MLHDLNEVWVQRSASLYVAVGMVVAKNKIIQNLTRSTQNAIRTDIYCMTVCLFVSVRTSRRNPPRTRPEPYYMCMHREGGHVSFVKIHWKKVLEDMDHPLVTQIPLLPTIPILPLFPSYLVCLPPVCKSLLSRPLARFQARALAMQSPLAGRRADCW